MADNMPLVARIMVQHGGDGPPAGPGVAAGGNGGGEPEETTKNIKKIATSMTKNTKGVMQNLGKTMGINVGIASILKQSQVFTGYIGTIFQLMGALVDVILAPFLPVLIPAIKLLASFIPIAGDLMKDIFKVLGFVWKGIVDGFKWLMSKPPLSWIPSMPEKIITGFKKALVAIILGAFFIKLFNMQKFALASGKTIASMSLTTLRIIAANTAMAGKGIVGGNAAARVSRGKMLKTSIRGFGRFAGFALILTAVSGILMRGFSLLGDKADTNNANQNKSMEGLTRLERSNRTGAETSSNKLESVIETGLGAVHMGLGIGQLATRTVGTKVASMFTGLRNLGMRQGRDALGRFTKNASMWGRMGARATSAAGAIKTGVANMKDRVAGVLNKKFPNLVKNVGLMKTAIRTKLGSVATSIASGIGEKITSAKTAITRGLTGLGTSIKGFFGGLGDKLGGLLNKIPGVKKATDIAKGVGSAVKGFLFGKGGGTAAEKAASKSASLFGRFGKVIAPVTANIGRLSKAALTGARAVPVLGAVAEAGYGAYKTYKSFKDYGMGAGFSRMAMSAAAVGGALIDPTGLLSAGGSFAGHAGLDYAERKGAFGDKRGNGAAGVRGGPQTINVIMDTGVGNPQERSQYNVQADQNKEITVNVGQPPMYRSGMGGF